MSEALAAATQLHKAGRMAEAAPLYLAHLEANPTDVHAAWIVAQWFMHTDQPQKALDLAEATSGYAPWHGPLRALCGVLHLKLGHEEQAEQALLAAVTLNPSESVGWVYLGLLAIHRGWWDKAVKLYRHALAVNADDQMARNNLGLLYLRLGNYRRGWDYYESRLDNVVFRSQHLRESPGKRWRGEPIRGQTLLVQAEQGAGDTWMFLRYLPLVAEVTGARVFFEFGRQDRLPILERCDLKVDGVAGYGDLQPDCAWHVPLMSLPWCLKRYQPFWPGSYVRAERQTNTGRIGYVWAGSTGHQEDAKRSTEKAQWAELLAIPGIEWVDCQVGRDGTFTPADWGETLARLCTLDRLITVDTGVAHLAGAIGLPADVLIPWIADWRWGVSGSLTPWYPSLTLHRQPSRGDWSPVFSGLVTRVSPHLHS